MRGRDGETACYPLVENVHRDGILRASLAPAPRVSATLQAEAERLAHLVLDALDYVGVLAVELFEYGKAARPGRKLGHVTVLADDAGAAAEGRARIEHLLAGT